MGRKTEPTMWVPAKVKQDSQGSAPARHLGKECPSSRPNSTTIEWLNRALVHIPKCSTSLEISLCFWSQAVIIYLSFFSIRKQLTLIYFYHFIYTSPARLKHWFSWELMLIGSINHSKHASKCYFFTLTWGRRHCRQTGLWNPPCEADWGAGRKHLSL